ncbi:MAG TPA: GAF domain-containing sensor histidine kinase [Thermoanaerobaculia bacterium]|jgi:two-component system NarL family sensor kinase|nr:GAF domain-containing sensor histidine kinase [Thermoanaerobaculia bacterium]
MSTILTGVKRELEIVAAVAEALNSAPTVQLALERTLEVIARELQLDTGWVWLIDPETGHVYNAAARNLPPYLQEPVRMTGASCWCIEQFRAGELGASNVDVMGCSRLRPAAREHRDDLTRGIAHHASVALYFDEKPLGIMNITAPEMRRLSARELRLLSTIGLQVGVAIERARLAEESAVHARADERTRIAREIHDQLAQGLTAIALQIESGRLEAALQTTRNTLEEARRSVMNLRAEPLAGRPLAQALALLAREFTSQSGIRVSLALDDCSLSLPAEAELYRIAEQALANVRQHAQAKHVAVSLRCARGSATLSVEDDGVGFDPRRVPDDRHGVRGMRERARLAGGTLRIASRPGTKIVAKVPR